MHNINLLPWRDRHQAQQKRAFLARAIAVIILALLILIAISTIYSIRIGIQRNKNRELQQHINQFPVKIAKLQILKKQFESKEKQFNEMQRLHNSRSQVVKFFKLLTEVTPQGIHLTEASRMNNKVTIKGNTTSHKIVSTMMRGILQSNLLIEPTLTEINKASLDGTDNISFTITATLPGATKLKEKNSKKPGRRS